MTTRLPPPSPVGAVGFAAQVAAQALRTPDGIAVVSGDRHVSYRELDRRSRALARRLAAHGAGPETVIGVIAERTPETVWAILGISRAGAAFLPLDPSYPAERLTYMLEDSGVEVVVSGAREAASPSVPVGGRTVVPAEEARAAPRPSDGPPGPSRNPPELTGESLAYVIYTSGSTGRPKGTLLHRDGLANLLRAERELIGADVGHRILQFAPFGFDASVFELAMALPAGATLVLTLRSELLPGLDLHRLLARERITHVTLPPSALLHLPEGLLSDLSTIVSAGEACPPAVAHRWAEGRRLYNAYGPTEATVWATVERLEAGAERVTIGRSIRGVETHVMDSDLVPVTEAARGELCLTGVGLARGYLRRPALTAERFVPAPLSEEPGARLYRTGDLVRRLADGRLDFFGRIDHQVKVRGHRIELGEIEAELLRHPRVLEAVVLAPGSDAGDRTLAAYVLPHDPEEPAELRRHLGESLPGFMVPTEWTFLDALPRTPSGKVDRSALLAVGRGARGGKARFRSPTEELLADLCRAVLGQPEIDPEQGFFDQGGTSLSAARLLTRIRESFRLELPVTRVFEAGTLRELAGSIDRGLAAGEPELPPMVARGDRGPHPLSFGQERVWFLHQVSSDNLAYAAQGLLHLRGSLRLTSLQRALQELVRRHQILRTTFPSRDGTGFQRVHPPWPVRLPVIDLGGLPGGTAQRAASDAVGQLVRRPFRLTRLPLIQWALLRMARHRHRLLQMEHHMLHDGWSFQVLTGELLELYRAFAEDLPSPLLEPALQFGDFARWQREAMAGPLAERQLGFWLDSLDGAETDLELPTDRPRPAVPSFRGDAPRAVLPAAVHQAMDELGRDEGVTLFMTMLAAFVALLHRYTGQTDVLVGSGVANRRWREVERLVGMLVNTVVLRTDLGGEPSFRELLRRVRRTTLEAYAHQDLPFERIVKALGLDRDLSQNPLFQVMFSFHDTPDPEVEIPGLDVALEPAIPNGSAKFDLNVVVVPQGDGDEGAVTMVWEYTRDLFEEATIRRMMGHYRNLLEAALAEPDRKLSCLGLLDPEEETLLLDRWNDRSAAFPQRLRLHERFERRALEQPDAVAIEDGGSCLTYGELLRRSRGIAGELRAELASLGAGPEARVGICLDRSAAIVESILGVLSAGGAYVPMDPAYPQERLSLLLEDAGVAVVLTTGEHRPKLESARRRLLLLEETEPRAGQEVPPPSPLLTPDRLAYVIYTSGSTGAPKGVMVSHGNVGRLMDATEAWFRFGPEDAWTLFHSYAFDFSVWEIWGALLYGGRLVVVPHWTSRTPGAFRELLARRRVTVLNQTPSAFRQLIRAEAEDDPPGEERLALRFVVFGGEALELRSLGPWFDRRPERAAEPLLVNMYGITETTVHVTYRPLAREETVAAGASPIGGPLPDLQLYALDPAGGLSPLGVPGELHVGGAGLARGYLDRPSLTARRFVPDPFHRAPGSRLYRSGDRGRVLADGEVVYLGRLDLQVQIRGFRIEPGEVEAVLRDHPGVLDAAVVAAEDPSGEPRLAAFAVVREGTGTDALRRWLRDLLPSHMVPPSLRLLAALPLTSHSKTDRRALAALGPGTPEVEGGFEAPRSDAEAALAEVWAQVLGADRVGIRDDFFDLGGDSILAVRVLAMARKRGFDVTLQQLFEARTVAGLARAAATGDGSFPGPPTRPFELAPDGARNAFPAEEVEDLFPLSALQLGMVYHGEADPRSVTYHNVSSLHLRAPFHLGSLERSLRRLAARHPALRTSFDLTRFEEPVQIVHRHAVIPLSVIDLRALPKRHREVALAHWIEAEKADKLDLSTPPLLRFRVLRRSDDRFQLGFTEHHAILDGWSVATMVTELLSTYFALLGKARPPEEEPPELSYRDFVAAERRSVASREPRRFWKGLLADAEPAHLPRLPRTGATERGPAPSRGRIDTVRSPVPDPLADGLRELARALLVPLKSLLLAAHFRVQALETGRDDVVTGMVSNGRPGRGGGDRLLGLFLNTLPLRQSLAPAGTWRELVRATFHLERECLPHRRFPLAEIRRAVGDRGALETAFNLNHFHVYDRVAGLPGLEILGKKFFQETSFALMVNFSVDPMSSGLELRLECDRTILGPARRRTLARRYLLCLETLVEAPDGRPDELALFTRAERHQLLLEWNDAGGRPEPSEAIHALVLEQADRTPDAVAVEHRHGAVSYGELRRRARGVAAALAGLGVGPGDTVAVSMDRSPELVCALLGVLEAGAAYLPLEPELPRERRRWILEDSGADVVIVRGGLPAPADLHGSRPLAVGPASPRPAPGGFAAPEVSPDHAAYVIYTSGSTGRPKGVVSVHRGITNGLRWAQRTYRLTPDDRILQKTPFGFDVSLWELFWPLTVGARIVLAEPGLHGDAGYLAELIERARITLAHFVPSVMEVFLDGLSDKPPVRLRHVLSSGEALSYELQRRFFERVEAELHNLYGPTEAAVHDTAWRCRPDDRRRVVPIGRPIAGLRTHVLDPRLRALPSAVPGELLLGGAGLARGYLGRPGLTAERFVPDPFGPPGDRLYRTGDLARRLPAGEIEFLGRLDFQVKVHGLRIELGEIEGHLAEHPAVQRAVVLARGRGSGTRLVAYLVADGGSVPSAPELSDHLRQHLPDSMVPTAYVAVDAFPATPSGKIDRRALPEPPERPRLPGSRVPATDLEEVIAAIWKEVLHRDEIPPRVSFFELGGHSLLATQVASRVREALDVKLSLSELFSAPTVAGLAARVEAFHRGGEGREIPPVRPGGSRMPPPLSYPQERFWRTRGAEARSPISTLPFGLRLTGELDTRALLRSLRTVLRRHDVFRVVYREVEGTPVQVHRPGLSVPILLADLSALPADRAAAEGSAILRDQSRSGFDLGRGPLARVSLIRRWRRDHALLGVLHHSIADGWSVGLFLRELFASYGASRRGEPAPLEALPVSYRDFATWQRRDLRPRVLREQLPYWRERLGSGFEPLELPLDRPRPPAPGYRAGRISLDLSPSLGGRIDRLGRAERCTQFMTLLAAYAVLLSRLARTDDVVVVTNVANRNRRETEGVFGLFVNLLALRIDLAGDPTFHALLARVRRETLAAYAHQDLPFTELVRHLGLGESLYEPFRAGFVLQNLPWKLPAAPGLRATPVELDTGTTKRDLMLVATGRGEALRAVLRYRADLFEGATAERWAEELRRILEAACDQPDRPVSAVLDREPVDAPARRGSSSAGSWAPSGTNQRLRWK